MYRKTEVIAQLNKFVEYSCTQNPKQSSSYKSLMVPLITAVENYYSADKSAYKAPLNELQLAFYNDLIKRKKHIIDKIDDYIGPLYGLNQEEIDFIKNYEIDIRLGDDD